MLRGLWKLWASKRAAAAIRGAVAAVLKVAKHRSPDLGGTAKTVEVANAVIERLK